MPPHQATPAPCRRVGFVLSYNMLGDVVIGAKFAAITRTGVSGLVHLLGSWRQQHR